VFAKVMITKTNAAKSRRESCVSGGGHALRRASLAMQNLFRQVVAQKSKVYSGSEGLPAHAMLVPLNAHTLLNPAVQDDLFEAIQAKMQVVLLHMQEEEFQAVPFAEFFEQCPDKLRDAGLFDTLARTWHFKEPYCTIATKLVGMSLEPHTTRNDTRNWELILEALALCKKVTKRSFQTLSSHPSPPPLLSSFPKAIAGENVAHACNRSGRRRAVGRDGGEDQYSLACSSGGSDR
jgi:hypothetical protein